MKKKWTKIMVGALVVTGLSVSSGNGFIEKDTPLAQTFSSSTAYADSANEVEGKVVAYTNKSIKVSFPFGGSKTYTINNNTIIDDSSLALKKGVLVEVKVNNKQAREIDTERTIDPSGTIVSDTKTKMTVTANGKKKTFTKTSSYYLDRDGYSGSVKGKRVELTLNSSFKLVSAEIDDDSDDD